ncbi:hypothetical protein AAFF_G00432420 [Aldrovandia affinis]|uniref:Uncharacterized protein n=1 Tax=Aldrovandia affinis TaxID=143900 RepID=A0AAD7S8G8_9TELE|nr:hypothetical protein AAFF_G00432420 [Aldrovandia affinis]
MGDQVLPIPLPPDRLVKTCGTGGWLGLSGEGGNWPGLALLRAPPLTPAVGDYTSLWTVEDKALKLLLLACPEVSCLARKICERLALPDAGWDSQTYRETLRRILLLIQTLNLPDPVTITLQVSVLRNGFSEAPSVPFPRNRATGSVSDRYPGRLGPRVRDTNGPQSGQALRFQDRAAGGGKGKGEEEEEASLRSSPKTHKAQGFLKRRRSCRPKLSPGKNEI